MYRPFHVVCLSHIVVLFVSIHFMNELAGNKNYKLIGLIELKVGELISGCIFMVKIFKILFNSRNRIYDAFSVYNINLQLTAIML